MAVIVTKAPKSCFECPAFATKACGLWDKAKTYSDQKTRRHEDCPLKSVEGLIERIRRQEFVHHTDNGGYYMEPAEIKDVVISIIKEYCGLEENNG